MTFQENIIYGFQKHSRQVKFDGQSDPLRVAHRCYAKAALNHFARFTRKQLCWSLFIIKLHVCRQKFCQERESCAGVFCEFFEIGKHPLQDKINEELGNLQIGQSITRMGPAKFGEDSLCKNRTDMIYLSRPYHFKFLKGCLPQI